MSKKDIDEDSKDNESEKEELGGPDKPSDISTHINLALTPPAKEALFKLYRETGESYRTIIRESLIQRARQLKRVSPRALCRAIQDASGIVFNELNEQFSSERVRGTAMKLMHKFLGSYDSLMQGFLDTITKSEGEEYHDYGDYSGSNEEGNDTVEDEESKEDSVRGDVDE